MELVEFVAAVPGFNRLSHSEKYKHFAWWLHTHKKRESFDLAAIRACYTSLAADPPANPSQELTRLAARRPREILPKGKGYCLEQKVRDALDRKYGQHHSTIQVTQLLKDLPGKVSDQAEQLFLSEAITCYRHRAFRAAIVMTWNLAYDHLLNWLLADAHRLAAFNANVAGRVGQKKAAGINIAKREDFEELKEVDVLAICGTAGVLPSHNIKRILDTQLTKRNLAAHPSLVTIGEPDANETIYNLTTNVVLALT